MKKHRKYLLYLLVIVLSAVFRPPLGLSSVCCLGFLLYLCCKDGFTHAISKHPLQTSHSLPGLHPSSASCCFEVDLFMPGGCCNSQIREIRVMQGCSCLLLSCSSKGQLQDMETEINFTYLRENLSIDYYWLDKTINRKSCTTHALLLYSLKCSLLAPFSKGKDGFQICSRISRDSMQCREAEEFCLKQH